jgi:hypothetical protein
VSIRLNGEFNNLVTDKGTDRRSSSQTGEVFLNELVQQRGKKAIASLVDRL